LADQVEIRPPNQLLRRLGENFQPSSPFNNECFRQTSVLAACNYTGLGIKMSIERFFGFYPVLFLIHWHDGVFFTQLLEELAQWGPGDSKPLPFGFVIVLSLLWSR
jgi:hypothetical protein